jgi:hypothetical protein
VWVFFLNCSLKHASGNLVELTSVDVSGKKTGTIGNLSLVGAVQSKHLKRELEGDSER